MIDIQDAFVTAGGTGFVDVLISSNGMLGDNVNGGSYFFEITPISGTGVLEFLPDFAGAESPQQSSSEQSDSDYLYFSDTTVINFSSVRQDPDKTMLVQSDGTLSGNNITITGWKLLARLELTQVLPGATGTFQISLKQDANVTFFVDSAASNVPIDAGSYTNFGTVTSSPSAVPEPSSLLLCSAAVAYLFRRKDARQGAKVMRDAAPLFPAT